MRARAFFAETLGFSSVDAGGGWLIFALPPAELAVHPTDGESRHELYLMCDDIRSTIADLKAAGVEIDEEVTDQRWGLVTSLIMPGGSRLGLYEPRHASPLSADGD